MYSPTPSSRHWACVACFPGSNNAITTSALALHLSEASLAIFWYKAPWRSFPQHLLKAPHWSPSCFCRQDSILKQA